LLRCKATRRKDYNERNFKELENRIDRNAWKNRWSRSMNKYMKVLMNIFMKGVFPISQKNWKKRKLLKVARFLIQPFLPELEHIL